MTCQSTVSHIRFLIKYKIFIIYADFFHFRGYLIDNLINSIATIIFPFWINNMQTFVAISLLVSNTRDKSQCHFCSRQIFYH